MSGEIVSAVGPEWVVILGTLFFFIFPGFIVLAGMAIRNERMHSAREARQFDALVQTFLKFSLTSASLDRRRSSEEVSVAVTLRSGRAQYMFHRKSVADRHTPGRRLATYIHAYHYIRNPFFRYGGIRDQGGRTHEAIRKFVFAQKWNLPIFLPPGEGEQRD